MARIAGVDIPNAKRVEIALTYIYGIGRTSARKILEVTGIDPDTRAKDLTEEINIRFLHAHFPPFTIAAYCTWIPPGIPVLYKQGGW